MSEQKQQLVEELKALLEQDVMAIKDQVDHIKTQFYRIENEAKSDLPGEGEEAAPEAEVQNDPVEEEFKALLAQYKAKRAAVAAEQAAAEQENLRRKLAIVEEMKTLAEGETDGVMANLQRMRELQAEWKTIGPVPAEKVSALRKDYQKYQEQFYDMVKINIELRDLDFKKNLELKTLLCEAAERLQQNESIVEASRALQQLHDEWAEIGPVARELREDLWNRFKEASTVINKKHQAYFDALHAKEQENLSRKQAIVEQLRELNGEWTAANGGWGTKQWEDATEKIQAMQSEWRTIGFAPKKYNQSIYDEYRTECDLFFHAKTAYFKSLRNELTANLEHKRALIDKVNELKNSEEWAATADAIRALQAEWKTIGPVARKYSDDLWKQFTAACDEFFNAKREADKEKRARRIENSGKRRENNGSRGETNLYRLREALQQEIKTAENNILFFTAKSKTANKIVDDMQRKIDALKAKLEDVKKQIAEENE